MRVAETLRSIINERTSKVIFLTELIDLLQDRIYGQFLDSTELKRIIASICRILPGWCRIMTIPKGWVLRCVGKERLQIGEIKAAITQHFSKQEEAL